MKFKRLHHVGIILPSMEIAEEFMKRFELEKDYMEYVEAYHAYCLFTRYSHYESPIELIIPTEGVLKEYRNGKGGLHHIAFEVEDVRETAAAFEGQGLSMLEEEPVIGAGGILVNFLRPRSGFGVLTEYVQEIKEA